MQFQLENLTHSAKDQAIIQLNTCAVMKHIHLKLVLELQMNPPMDSQAWMDAQSLCRGSWIANFT